MKLRLEDRLWVEARLELLGDTKLGSRLLVVARVKVIARLGV